MVGLAEAKQTPGRIDGRSGFTGRSAWPWLIDSILLDFYHLAEHVHATARCCLGEGTGAALAWASSRLAEARASNVKGMLEAIEMLEKQVRSAKKEQSLQGLRHYLGQRLDVLDYAAALEAGQDIGSGPTEAGCKTLTLRLNGPGMKRDRDNARG